MRYRKHFKHPVLSSQADSSPAFSLVELLVVIAILLVLAGIVFSVVASSRKKSLETVDISNLRQVYLAVVMYEEQNNQGSPATLLNVLSMVGDERIFRSLRDPVTQENPSLGGFTAQLFVGSDIRSPFRISYAYLKTYPPYDVNDNAWNEKRSNPVVGMLASPWHGEPGKLHVGSGVWDDHGPPMNGPVLRINMDGSFFRLPSNRQKDVLGSTSDLFYNR